MIRFTRSERAQIAACRLLLAAPAALRDRLLGAPIERDGHTLDRQFQIALELDRRLRPGLARDDIPLDKSRRDLELRSAVMAPRPPALHEVRDLTLGADGAMVNARLYRPRAGALPALVFFHGGGWVQGSLDSHDTLCRLLAERAACVVIAVDYRLAPEHPFPAAVADAVLAFRAVHRDAAPLGIDRDRIAVGGDSAGGNLAAVVALLTRGDAARPCFQLLVYPALDLTMSMPSIESLGRGFFLEREAMEWFRAQYLPPGADRRDPRASPLHAQDLSGLPPAFVMTAGFDPLRDEGEAYARRLREAGVQVRYACYGPLVHGFLNTTGTVIGARPALEDATAALREVAFLAPAGRGASPIGEALR